MYHFESEKESQHFFLNNCYCHKFENQTEDTGQDIFFLFPINSLVDPTCQ
jgi:hypothetical protein